MDKFFKSFALAAGVITMIFLADVLAVSFDKSFIREAEAVVVIRARPAVGVAVVTAAVVTTAVVASSSAQASAAAQANANAAAQANQASAAGQSGVRTGHSSRCTGQSGVRPGHSGGRAGQSGNDRNQGRCCKGAATTAQPSRGRLDRHDPTRGVHTNQTEQDRLHAVRIDLLQADDGGGQGRIRCVATLINRSRQKAFFEPMVGLTGRKETNL